MERWFHQIANSWKLLLNFYSFNVTDDFMIILEIYVQQLKILNVAVSQ